MRILLRAFLLLIVLTPFALGALVWFALAEQPALNTDMNLSHRNIERAKAIIKRHDPRHAASGSAGSIAISEQDLSLAANYLLRRILRGAVEIKVGDGAMDISGTAHLPLIPPRPYVNVRLRLEDTGATPRIGAQAPPIAPAPASANWPRPRATRPCACSASSRKTGSPKGTSCRMPATCPKD